MRANLTPEEKQSMIDMLRTITDEMLSVLWKTITTNAGGISGMDPDLLKAFYNEFERRPGLLESLAESKRRNTVKITKLQLRQIIKEEKQKLLSETMIEADAVEGIVEAAVEGYQTGLFRNGAQIVSFVRQECNKLSLDHKFDQIISRVINSMLEF